MGVGVGVGVGVRHTASMTREQPKTKRAVICEVRDARCERPMGIVLSKHAQP